VANRIAHPGVVRILDDDDDDETQTVFLVMELLEGETMEARWERSGRRLPVAQVLACADRVLDVLAAAHEQGVVHRDVKPENIFATTQEEMKVLDLGIARLLDGTGATQSGQVLGTPGFMAPEQANGRLRQIDARTDLWAVGAVIFTLVTGEEVHDGKTGAVQMIYAATRPARALESVAPWVPRDVATMVNKALAYERDARFPSALAMQEALRATRAYDVLSATVGVARSVQPPSLAPPTERVPMSATKTIVQGSVPGDGEGGAGSGRRD